MREEPPGQKGQTQLEAAGWKETTVADFLGMTPEEEATVERALTGRGGTFAIRPGLMVAAALIGIEVGATVPVEGAPDDAHAITVPLPSLAEQLRGTSPDDVAVRLVFERVDDRLWKRTK